MAAPAVIDRFKQIEPKVLIACDGVTYAGAGTIAGDVIAELRAIAADGRACHHPQRHAPSPRLRSDALLSDDLVGNDGADDRRVRAGVAAVRPSALDRLFQRHDRPAEADRARPWRHRHRGAAAERACTTTSAAATTPNSFGERYHWYSSTGWIMWNSQVGGLLSGTTSASSTAARAASKDKPDWTTLWRFVASRRRPSSARARRSSPTA